MKIEKTTCNFIRKTLNTFIKKTEKDLEWVAGVKGVTKHLVASPETLKKIRDMAHKRGITTPTAAEEHLIDALENVEESIKNDIKKAQGLILAISRDGVKDVTYSFPLLCIFCFGSSIDYPYLFFSAVSKNATSKQDDGPLMDDVERSLLEYERKMARYISDDMIVKLNDLGPFLDLFCDYIKEYVDEKSISLADNFNLDAGLKVFQTSFVHYLLNRILKIVMHESEFMTFIHMASLTAKNENISFGVATQRLAERILEEYGVDFESALREFRSGKEKTEPVVTIGVLNPIVDYVKNGVVYKVCDLDVFRKLLDESPLSDNIKDEYLAQMRNLINKKAKKELERQLAEARSNIFSDEEMALYNLAKKDATLKTIVDEIDVTLEMLLESKDDEDRLEFLDELRSLFVRLETVFSPRIKQNDAPLKVAYYTVGSANGENRLPKVYTSLLQLEACKDADRIVVDLNKIIEGFTSGDMELRGSDLPCRVYTKGDEFKIFYTQVGDVPIIIDGMRVQNGDFKAVLKTVLGDGFKDYLKTLQKDIYGGEHEIDGREHTALIMGELDKNMGNPNGKKHRFDKKDR